IVYLLLYQREVVERSLERVAPGEARAYLEKIVQVPFSLPPVERIRVERVLFAGLDALVNAEAAIERRFDQHRWQNLYAGGLRRYFVTLRDVRRFLSTLAFHVSVFRGTGTFEVNPVDLIALETLRVFEPDVYR